MNVLDRNRSSSWKFLIIRVTYTYVIPEFWNSTLFHQRKIILERNIYLNNTSEKKPFNLRTSRERKSCFKILARFSKKSEAVFDYQEKSRNISNLQAFSFLDFLLLNTSSSWLNILFSIRLNPLCASFFIKAKLNFLFFHEIIILFIINNDKGLFINRRHGD